MLNPAVSVVMPVFNGAETILQSVASALNQTEPPLEVVIVDDGSRDNTLEVLRSVYAGDPRISILEQPNSGVSMARNRGIEAAQGHLIQFLDADDILLPIKIAESVALFLNDPDIAVVYGHGQPVEMDGTTLIPYVHPPLPSGDILCEWITGVMANGVHGVVPTFMVRREVLLDAGGFDPSLSHGEDWDLWIRLAARNRFAALDQVLVHYRRRPEGAHRQRVAMARGRLDVIRKTRHLPEAQTCLDPTGWDALEAARWHVLGLRLWESGFRPSARDAFLAAASLTPQGRLARHLNALMCLVLPVRAAEWPTAIRKRLRPVR